LNDGQKSRAKGNAQENEKAFWLSGAGYLERLGGEVEGFDRVAPWIRIEAVCGD
jgi:hypothetical protein